MKRSIHRAAPPGTPPYAARAAATVDRPATARACRWVSGGLLARISK